MLNEHLKQRGISEQTLEAFRKADRSDFVDSDKRDSAYEDHPLSIGYSQTISQPYIVALMTDALHLRGSEKVLEIATGSGFQTAILSHLAADVYSIERIAELYQKAAKTLAGYPNVRLCHGNGYEGRPDAAPFDRILLTAAPEIIPSELKKQLKTGGMMVLPVGSGSQKLVSLTKISESEYHEELISYVRFVPMIDS